LGARSRGEACKPYENSLYEPAPMKRVLRIGGVVANVVLIGFGIVTIVLGV
jgi:hypothetical protein